MRILLFLSLICIFGFSSSSFAACYKSLEAEAEQGIRIHSELMVIGLNCQHMASANGKNLYSAYREFTNEHANLFGKYEEILMDFYRKSGEADPEQRLNILRTTFANKISNDAAGMRPDMFCKKYSPRILEVLDLEMNDIRRWSATIYPSHPVSQPLCEGVLPKES